MNRLTKFFVLLVAGVAVLYSCNTSDREKGSRQKQGQQTGTITGPCRWTTKIETLDFPEKTKLVQEGVRLFWMADKMTRANLKTELQLNYDDKTPAGDGRKVLFQLLDPKILRYSANAAILELLSKYEQDMTPDDELKAGKGFLHKIEHTPVYEAMLSFFKDHKLCGDIHDDRGYQNVLANDWFTPRQLYGDGSFMSTFKRVFVGYIDNSKNKIRGMNSWLQIYRLETRSQEDKFKYKKVIPFADGKFSERLPTLSFSYEGVETSRTDVFMGTGAAFDFAVFAMCFAVVNDGMFEIFLGDCTKATLICSRNGDLNYEAYISLRIYGTEDCPFVPAVDVGHGQPTVADATEMPTTCRLTDQPKMSLHEKTKLVQEGIRLFWMADKLTRANLKTELQLKYDTSYVGQKKLFQSVVQSVLDYPANAAMLKLLSKYSFEHDMTPENEKNAGKAFLDEIGHTSVYKAVLSFFKEHKICSGVHDDDGYQSVFKNEWFTPRQLSDQGRSMSTFRRVFAGYIDKNDKIKGMNTWLQLYRLEAASVNGEPFLYKEALRVNGKFPERLPTLSFSYKDAETSRGYVVMGPSPVFEFAVFTMCSAVARDGMFPIFLGDCSKATLTCSRNGDLIYEAHIAIRYQGSNDCPFVPVE